MARRAKSRGSPAEGAKLAEMPGFIKPQLATLKSKPSGRQLLNEFKYDGYRRSCKRAMAARRPIRATDLIGPKRFSAVARAFDIPGQAIVDGEAVVIKDGRTNFSELQAALGGCRQATSSTTPSTCCTSTATICARCHKLSASGSSRSCLMSLG
jgi:bifunctional non-homologous end joining protein LigD